MAAAFIPVSAVYAAYTDVQTDAWYYDAVTVSTAEGWFSGYEDGTFAPEGTITRAEAMKVLLTYKFGEKLPEAEKNTYKDVAENAWYKDYVSVNGALDIIPSDKDNFRPEEKITREDAMYGLISVLGFDMMSADLSRLDGFGDSEEIAFGKRQAVAMAVEKGFVGGYEDDTIRPDGSITRAEFAAIMQRASKSMEASPTEEPQETASPEATAAPTESPEVSAAPTATPEPVNQKDGENLFDYSYTSGKVIDTATGNEKDGVQYITSDYISIVPGEKYFCATYSPSAAAYTDTCTAYAYYDADKNFISGGTKSMKTPAAAPENAAYIRFSIKQTAELTYHERLAAYTVFAKSSEALTEFSYPVEDSSTDKFIGKKVYFYGDDFIKNGSGWLNILEKNIGVQIGGVYGNRAFGANNTNSLCATDNINNIPKDADYIFVYGGLNDWLNGYSLGEVNEKNDVTVSGGAALLNKRLKEKYSNAEIIYITPCTAAAFGRSNFTADGRRNGLGLTVEEYAQAIKEQAEADGLRVIDLNKECGISADNIEQYIPKNGNSQFYPNGDGCKLIGEYLLQEIIK